MDNLVRAFTTRQPAVGLNGTTLQRNITIYVLVAGIAGGLLLVLAILLLCKYCSRSRPRPDATAVRVTVLKGAVTANNNCHLAASDSDSDVGRLNESPENAANFSCIRTPEVSVALSSTKAQQQQQQRSTSNGGANKTSPTLAVAAPPPGVQHPMDASSSATGNKDDADSYVIQVEPVRILSASPTSPGAGVDSWRSSDDAARDVRLRPDDWAPASRRLGDDDIQALDTSQTASVSNRHKRSLQHAASHPSARDAAPNDAASSVSRRRLEWRNSHRNYRSTPTTSASRDAHYAALNYETRRALRDCHQQRLHEQPSFDLAPTSSYAGARRMLPKRGGSVRETGSPASGKESTSAPDATTDGSQTALCPAASAAHVRCQMITSPATKRWRCHTVDCPCSNNVSAPAVPHDLMDASALAHRHSFPSSGGVAEAGVAGQSLAGGHNQRQHYHHRRDDRAGHFSGARSKDVYCSGSYLDRSESLDWAGFQRIVSPGASGVVVGASSASGAGSVVHDDDASSLITDDDEVAGVQMQPSSAPRITIRYNDPGSLESVNEENLFFCLDADNKKEFRQRLEKTIHAQYRQVWELRANLEEQTEFYEHPSSPEPELNPVSFANEVEMPIIGQASFDSNSEAPPDEEEDDDSSYTIPDSPAKNAIPSNSGLWKRQSYRSIAMNARLRRQTGVQMAPPVNQPQSSFDSVDTIETSSTDASRLEQMTTSFESSATDSTNGTETAISNHPPASHHRLLNARDDSGYRSIESSAGVPLRLPSKTSPTFNAAADETTSDGETSLLRPGEQQLCQCRGDVHDEKCERNKPVVFARCTRYGLKARSASTQNPPTSSASWRQQQQQQRLHQHRSHQILARDYSIDERTDAIFREFSRCDPVYEASKSGSRKDLRQGFNHRARWLSQHHQRHDPQHQHRFMSFQDGASLAPEPSDALLHCTLKE